MARQGEDRLLTVPNVLSIGRLCCVPVFVWLLFGREDRYAAGLLLAALGITDFADGWIARHFHQESKLGKILDPTADRILLGVGVLAVLIDGSMPWWVAALAITRESVVGLSVLGLAGGGLLYTIGAVVYARERPDPSPANFGYHEIFHVCVIVAAGMHYAVIAFAVLPQG